jgi:hypothetical protein
MFFMWASKNKTKNYHQTKHSIMFSNHIHVGPTKTKRKLLPIQTHTRIPNLVVLKKNYQNNAIEYIIFFKKKMFLYQLDRYEFRF